MNDYRRKSPVPTDWGQSASWCQLESEILFSLHPRVPGLTVGPRAIMKAFFTSIVILSFSVAAVAQEAAESSASEAVELEAPTPFDAALQWLSDLLRGKVAENSGAQIAAFFGLILGTLVLRRLIMNVVFAGVHKIASRTKSSFDDQLIRAIEQPMSAFVLVVGLFLAAMALSLPPEIDGFLVRAFQAATMTIVFWGFLRVIDTAADILSEIAQRRNASIFPFIPLIKRAARIFLIIIGVIVVIQNLGYSVGSLLAGLGIGGLAIALAAQESLGNFFGSVSIAADRPFKIGDWIQVGDKVDGDVEDIGLRSTKVRTWAKSQLTIPNKVLANEIIENWSRMPKRRVKQVVGVTYETCPDDMEGLVEDIRGLLRDDEGVDQNFILVNFTDFGASSLDILVYYFTTTTKWLEHMDIRQRINLKIMRAVAARGLSVAFPTRTVYFEGEVARRLADGGNTRP